MSSAPRRSSHKARRPTTTWPPRTSPATPVPSRSPLHNLAQAAERTHISVVTSRLRPRPHLSERSTSLTSRHALAALHIGPTAPARQTFLNQRHVSHASSTPRTSPFTPPTLTSPTARHPLALPPRIPQDRHTPRTAPPPSGRLRVPRAAAALTPPHPSPHAAFLASRNTLACATLLTQAHRNSSLHAATLTPRCTPHPTPPTPSLTADHIAPSAPYLSARFHASPPRTMLLPPPASVTFVRGLAGCRRWRASWRA